MRFINLAVTAFTLTLALDLVSACLIVRVRVASVRLSVNVRLSVGVRGRVKSER